MTLTSYWQVGKWGLAAVFSVWAIAAVLSMLYESYQYLGVAGEANRGPRVGRRGPRWRLPRGNKASSDDGHRTASLGSGSILPDDHSIAIAKSCILTLG